MNYLSVFLVGLIVGLLGDVFFFFYYSNKHRIFTPKEKEKGWATKDDIFRITKVLIQRRKDKVRVHGGLRIMAQCRNLQTDLPSGNRREKRKQLCNR